MKCRLREASPEVRALIGIVGAATGLALSVLLFVWCFWMQFQMPGPSQRAMVDSGYSMIPEARQIDDLSEVAWHRTANYRDHNVVQWQTDAMFDGRYELTMTLEVQISRWSGKALKVLESPKFTLAEISVEVGSHGSIGIRYHNARQFVCFRQACMNRFERCGIVGCRNTILWRTAYGYQKGARPSCAAGRRAAAV